MTEPSREKRRIFGVQVPSKARLLPSFSRRTLLQSLGIGSVALLPAASEPDMDQAIRQVVAAMESAWNRGDFAGYMAGFKNPDVVFVSNGRIQADWQGTLDHYVRDYGASAETRGNLRFYDMTIEPLSPDAAQLIGHFRLTRPGATMVGVNTRLFRKVAGNWVIALNHVSAYQPG